MMLRSDNKVIRKVSRATAFLMLLLGLFICSMTAQSRITEHLGAFQIQAVETTSSKAIAPPLKDREGIIQIKLGPKLKAYLSSIKSKENFVSLSIREVEYERSKTRVDLSKPEYSLRYTSDYLINVKSNSHVLSLTGLTDFEEFRSTIRLTVGKVNSFILELDNRPIYREIVFNRTLRVRSNVTVFRVELYKNLKGQGLANLTGIGKDKLYEASGTYSGKYLLIASAVGFQPIELPFDWGEQAVKDIVLTFTPLLNQQAKIKGKKRRPLLWIMLTGVIGGGAYIYLQSQGSSSAGTLPIPPGRPN